MKWTEEYRINVHDTDRNGIVSVSGLLRYMQDTVNLNMAGEGQSYEELFAQGYSFVLSRLGISLYAPLYSHDIIRCQTWAVEGKGVTFNRCYRVYRGEDIVAEATSAWALLNVKEQKLCRNGEIPMPYSTDAPLELDLPTRFRIPSEVQLSLRGERTVLYADIDQNGHLNNTHYPDMLCSYLPDMQGRRVINMVISFASEAPLGETEKIYCGEYDGMYYVRSVRPSGVVNAEAEILLESL